MEQSLISVIVPVYKVEKYLAKCIDSILSQTYQNLEVILVDDGSPDACPEICDEYAGKDSRVKVIHKENGGVSSARNAGLDIAKGEYIGFVDSDDETTPRMYEVLVNCMAQHGADIAICSAFTVYEDTVQVEYQKLLPNDLVMDRDQAMKNLFAKLFLLGGSYFWNKLFKASLFGGIRFPDEKCGEDVALIYKMIYRAEKVVFHDEPLYRYLIRKNSLSHSVYSLELGLRTIGIWEEAFEFCQVNNIAKKEVSARCMGAGLNELYRLFTSDTAGKDFENQYMVLRQFVLSHHMRGWTLLVFKQKILAVLLFMSRRLYFHVYKGYFAWKKRKLV